MNTNFGIAGSMGAELYTEEVVSRLSEQSSAPSKAAPTLCELTEARPVEEARDSGWNSRTDPSRRYTCIPFPSSCIAHTGFSGAAPSLCTKPK
jgi:hypothetical protein